MMRPEIFLGDRLLSDVIASQSADETANALGRLVDHFLCGKSFRVQPDAPFIQDIAGQQILECCTSGSSGPAKIIRRSWQSWLSSFAINQKIFSYQPQDRVAVFGTISHSLALYGFLEALYCGLGIHMLHGLWPKSQMSQLVGHGITILYATPTQLRMLKGEPVETVRLVLCGGGALDPATRDQIAILFPNADLRVFYGASETSFITLADRQTPAGSVGRSYPGVTLEIRNADDGSGEIWIKSPYIFDGYAQGNSSSFERDGEFVTVGETGYLDKLGNLFLKGRRDRMVTIADQNVHPEALETFLASRLPTRLSAVMTVPDKLRGHFMAAYIEAGDTALDEAALRHEILETLGAVMIPRHIVMVENFALLPSGKPDLKQLQKDHPWR
nr:AMP-binding protein [uncultured Cohaesibacter sp.]